MTISSAPFARNQGTQKRSVGSRMVNHQVVNGETVEGNKVLKHTWQSNRKLRKIQQQACSIGEEMEKLRSLLGSLNKPTRTCFLALSSTPPLSFCINASHRVYANSWIIDSGATDHMTSKSQLFHTYTPSPSNKKIAVANGSLATVAGFGDIYITSTLILKNVLHVLRLSANLVSIQKLIHDLKCYAIFFLLIVFFGEEDWTC